MSAYARATIALSVLVIAACSSESEVPVVNTKPDYIKSAIVATSYDGTANDLLTAGLGKSGLQSATPPAAVDPANPTVEELRKLGCDVGQGNYWWPPLPPDEAGALLASNLPSAPDTRAR